MPYLLCTRVPSSEATARTDGLWSMASSHAATFGHSCEPRRSYGLGLGLGVGLGVGLGLGLGMGFELGLGLG